MGRLDRLESRRYDAAVRASLAGEVYKRMRDSESIRYTIGAMQPIDPEYTKNTFAQGDRVKSQLEQRLSGKHDFEYQGSVTTDTHIKAKSDIDLLLIQTAWFGLESPQALSNPYVGDAREDMRALRRNAATALQQAFPQASLNNSGATAIRLTGGSLTRDIDIVPASWYHTNEYVRTGDQSFKGVEVFNQDTNTRIPNTPRLHKRRIEERDQRVHGGLRKAVRLMKSLMYDSDGRVTMSSYNIVGIAFNIPDQELQFDQPRELAILEACCSFCSRLVGEPLLRDSIRVPDGRRTVFGSGQGASLPQLNALTKELLDLRSDVLSENIRSFAKLSEARVEHPLSIVGR
ncbi:MAG: hypothetical protein U0640_13115 [Phycisphaerales bacterium]